MYRLHSYPCHFSASTATDNRLRTTHLNANPSQLNKGRTSSNRNFGGRDTPRYSPASDQSHPDSAPGPSGRDVDYQSTRPAGSSQPTVRNPQRQRQPPHHTAPSYLTSVPIVRPGGRDEWGTFYSSRSWRDAGASKATVEALRTLGISRPSHIQVQAFQALLGRNRRVALADAAGSGKTLAYLLPLLQILKEEEEMLGEAATQPGCPRLVILAPTAELVQQVYRVVKSLSGAGMAVRSIALSSTGKVRTQKDALKQGVDVVVATPGRLLQLLQDGTVSLVFATAVVMDEVDVLLGDAAAFKEQVQPLVDAAADTTRIVMVTATLPTHTFEQVQDLFPDVVAAFGPGLHRVAPGLEEMLVDCSGGEEISLESGTARKLEALEKVLEHRESSRAII